MLSKGVREAGSRLSRWIRDSLLVLGVGVLASQALIALNGGRSIGVMAEASTMDGTQTIQIVDLDLQLDPGTPSMISSVRFSAHLPEKSNPDNVKIEVLSGRSNVVYRCDLVRLDTWVCQTGALLLSEFKGIRAYGSG
ncbi:MAG: hypothetical protein PVI04_07750 [Anaerolineales bacterium]|jgi:hypothetical protein